jgi:XTP/dITP diphosphohydrolase
VRASIDAPRVFAGARAYPIAPVAATLASSDPQAPLLGRSIGETHLMALTLDPGAKLVVATHNPGKARELAEILENRFRLVTAGELGLPEPEETEASFTGNALLKARAAAEASGLPALADDSGLSVTALDGAPGVYSARWAGPGKDFSVAMRKVEERLEETGSDDLTAWFTCALALAWPGGAAVVCEGRVDGALTFPPRGDRGFGYDPIFVPDGFSVTFGEMEPTRKDAMSHRARAFAKLKAALW